jgi:hypothetical protein
MFGIPAPAPGFTGLRSIPQARCAACDLTAPGFLALFSGNCFPSLPTERLQGFEDANPAATVVFVRDGLFG